MEWIEARNLTKPQDKSGNQSQDGELNITPESALQSGGRLRLEEVSALHGFVVRAPDNLFILPGGKANYRVIMLPGAVLP